MPKTFKTAAAFRTSLEQRLKQLAATRAVPLNSLRLKVVIERLLARLFAEPSPPWLLKGGFAMELRYRPRARTTKDIDLGVAHPRAAGSVQDRLTLIRDELQESAARDLGDFLDFTIGAPQGELQGAPLGGGRFPVEARLAGKTYAKFRLDVGFGDPLGEPAERLKGDDVLAFVGISPIEVLAIPRAQQFAEKVHAYTFRWADRINTRTKDLIDLILMIDAGLPDPAKVRRAIQDTFAARGSHAVPSELSPPPETWREDFALLAAESQLSTRDLFEGFRRVTEFWQENTLGA